METQNPKASYLRRCLNPSFLGKGKNRLFSVAQYQIYGRIEGGTLTDLSFTGEEREGERGLIDACLELFLKKNRETLGPISFRELESFLREQNHLPALPETPSLSSWFTSTKKSFMRA